MAKFHYAPIPEEVLCDPKLSWTMKGRYGLLVGAAFNRESLNFSLEKIAELWSEAEGEAIDAESAGAYLGLMAQAGLIRREQAGRYNWRTRLLKRYIGHQTATEQNRTDRTEQTEQAVITEPPGSSRGLEAETPRPSRGLSPEGPIPASGAVINSNDVVDDFWDQVDRLEHQQQQLFDALLKICVQPETAYEFVTTKVLARIETWIVYALINEKIKDPAGFVVAMVGGDKIPFYAPRPGSAEARRYKEILREMGLEG